MSQKKKKPIPDYTVVIDLEMCRIFKKVYAQTKTRKFPVKREIMQIGAVLLDKDGDVKDQFRSYVHPEYGKLENVVKDMTGITKQDLDDALSFDEVLDQFVKWLPDGSIQAASWGTDDKKQLKNECLLKHVNTGGKIDRLLDRWLNLQPKYGSKVGLKDSVSLEDAMRISGVEPNGRSHDALNDAMNTAMLYQKLVKKQKLIVDKKFINEKREEENERHNNEETGIKRKMQERHADEKPAQANDCSDILPDMDIQSAESNLVVFYGSNEDPIPQDLFLLWNRIMKRGYKTYPCACCLNLSYYEIEEYDAEHNVYTSCNGDFGGITEQTYHPFDTTIGISLYDDRYLHRKMFAIIMTTDGEGIGENLYARNTLVVETQKWLKNEYNRWSEIRRRNPGKYNQIRETVDDEKEGYQFEFCNDLVCELCLYTEQCDRINCIMSMGHSTDMSPAEIGETT